MWDKEMFLGRLRLTRVRGVPLAGEVLSVGELARKIRVGTTKSRLSIQTFWKRSSVVLPAPGLLHRWPTRDLAGYCHPLWLVE